MPLWQRRKRAFSISRHGQLCLALPWSYEGLAAKFSQQTPAAMKREQHGHQKWLTLSKRSFG